jgi:uncharacterized protein (TIGR02452 family)
MANDTLERVKAMGAAAVVVSTSYLPDARACRAAGIPETCAVDKLLVTKLSKTLVTTSCDGGGAAAAAAASTVFEVLLEGTLTAAARYSAAGIVPCALNFASAKHPGGGFLRGASAQEEALCRVSALYPAIKDSPVFDLVANEPYRKPVVKCGIYHDTCVFSPNVLVIKDDGGQMLHMPFATSFLTCPAVNAGHARKCGVAEAEIASAMERRLATVLAVAAAHQQRNLILGAFGTGVFQNTVQSVARAFSKLLCGPYSEAFDSVCFAVIKASDADTFAAVFKVEVGPKTATIVGASTTAAAYTVAARSATDATA